MIDRILKTAAASTIIAVLTSVSLFGQVNRIPWLDYQNEPAVDTLLKNMSVKDMVAQSFWIPAWDYNGEINYPEVENLVVTQHIGGILFAEGSAQKQIGLIHHLDSLSGIPLIISTDAEWGTGMRLAGVESYPYQMTLGAIQNDSLIYNMGVAIADECRAVGINVNLAPVADVNNNPQNPVINYRSFGEDPSAVSRKATLYMKGMQDNGIVACAKHFPGHGDTNVDSHKGLPELDFNRARFDSLEFVPFKKLINSGIGSVMTAHIYVPSLDSTPKLPATYSQPIVTRILKNELCFQGLIITDAMSMEGSKGTYQPGVAEAKAYEAGNDIIEYSPDPAKAIEEITRRIESGEIPLAVAQEKCRKILALKHWLLKSQNTRSAYSITPENLSPSPKLALIRDLYSKAITLLENRNSIIPVKGLDKVTIATVSVNGEDLALFREAAGRYTRVDNYAISTTDMAGAAKTLEALKNYDIVLAGFSGLSQKPQISYGITPELRSVFSQLSSLNNCIITWFGNPYGIGELNIGTAPAGLILTYQNNQFTQEAAVEVIFGALGASGRLPVTIDGRYPMGSGLTTQGNLRLQYGYPENASMSSAILFNRVDSIVKEGLDSMAYPGCEVLIARKGIVVYNKTFGYHTYDTTAPMRSSDLFDLASVSKVSGTTPCLIYLNGEGRFNPNRTLGSYLPYFSGSNKDTITLKDMLTHQSGFVAFIPFYKNTMNADGSYKKGLYSHHFTNKYDVQVADSLFLTRSYRKEIFETIRNSKVGAKKYLYSDLNFILAAEVVQAISGETVEQFAPEYIYHRLGAYDITYRPMEKYARERIVPTENDQYWRHQQLQGYVHDEGAALLGGVAGHAGLFATGNDLLKLIETYRRMGSYGGEQIFDAAVMKKYTSVQFPENNNRRGLCFDKPSLSNGDDRYPCKSASASSFGHSGFTGTFVWADPDAEITFVFLSNRVYPTRDNSKLSDLNIRTRILQAIYDSIEKEDKR
ncbi:MAG TPA: glycoside hydrolase family 3 N-terminal domain-containing protein [Bacteroidales bacterium]|nr:glycoside hydrolase family 3 N-terminal domain-containing protein [Bacteroidales bacterium]